MGIYEGYQKFRRKNGLISYRYSELRAAELRYGRHAGLLEDGFLQIVTGNESYVIEVEWSCSLKKQIAIIFHELLHLSKKYSLARYSTTPLVLDKLHAELDEEAHAVYNCQPNLVKHMRKKLKSLIKLYKRRSLKTRVIDNLNLIKSQSALENKVEAIGVPKDDPLYIRLLNLRKLRGDSGVLFLDKMLRDIKGLEKRIMKEGYYNKLLSASDKDFALEYGVGIYEQE